MPCNCGMPKLHSSGRGGKGKCPPTGGARRQSKLARSRLRKVACSQNSGLARVGHLHAESRSKLWNPQIPADRTQRCTKSENLQRVFFGPAQTLCSGKRKTMASGSRIYNIFPASRAAAPIPFALLNSTWDCSQYVLPRFSTFWPHGHGMQEVPCCLTRARARPCGAGPTHVLVQRSTGLPDLLLV